MKAFRNFFYPTIIVSLLFVTSCCLIKDFEYRRNTAEDISESKFANTNFETNETFLTEAAEIGLEEILFAQLAQKKGLSQYVKRLGKKIELAHHKFLKEINEIAAQRSIIVPTLNNETVLMNCEKMRIRFGTDFDKSFCRYIIKCHKQSVDLFEKTVVSTSDSVIRNFALDALPELQELLENAASSQSICKKNKRCYPTE